MNRKFSLCTGRRGTQVFKLTNSREQPNGFTLMELLIVMAIIAILMLIAIPTVGSLTKKANDLSAIASIRAIRRRRFSTSLPTRRMASPAR